MGSGAQGRPRLKDPLGQPEAGPNDRIRRLSVNSAETIERVPIHTDADGVVRVAGTRVTLDTVVGTFDTGATAEEIAQQYSSVPLADVYSVITYYLRHNAEVCAYVQRRNEQALSRSEAKSNGGSRPRVSESACSPAVGRNARRCLAPFVQRHGERQAGWGTVGQPAAGVPAAASGQPLRL